MAFRRGGMNRRGRRRFFRRRSRYRPTTEQGGRLERCHFNIGIDQPVSPTGSPVSDIIMAVGGNSLIGALGVVGTQAQAVGRLLQNPMRDYTVEAIILDVEAFLDPGSSTGSFFGQLLQCGFAVNTQRLDAGGDPTSVPPYWLSQWPVNQTTGISTFNEDMDYGTRTHFHRAWTLAPHTAVSEAYSLPGWPRIRLSQRIRIKRRIPDTYGLFFQTWNFRDGAGVIDSNAIQWFLTGSLWYRMRL